MIGVVGQNNAYIILGKQPPPDRLKFCYGDRQTCFVDLHTASSVSRQSESASFDNKLLFHEALHCFPIDFGFACSVIRSSVLMKVV